MPNETAILLALGRAMERPEMQGSARSEDSEP